jgi:hypothetical protein
VFLGRSDECSSGHYSAEPCRACRIMPSRAEQNGKAVGFVLGCRCSAETRSIMWPLAQCQAEVRIDVCSLHRTTESLPACQKHSLLLARVKPVEWGSASLPVISPGVSRGDDERVARCEFRSHQLAVRHTFLGASKVQGHRELKGRRSGGSGRLLLS